MEQLIQSSIDAINEYAQDEIAELLAEIQVQRFKNQGEFLDHKKWENNPKDISYEKFYRKPLIQTGELKREMTNKSNWNKEVKLQKQGLKQQFVIPQTESFSNPKYDKQNTGGVGGSWKGLRTGKDMSVENVKARPFKSTSETDIIWVAQQLAKKLKEKFSNG